MFPLNASHSVNRSSLLTHLPPNVRAVIPSPAPGRRGKRQAPPVSVQPRHSFPSVETATKADDTLQKNVNRWLGLGQVAGNIIPLNASIEPFLKLYTEALNEPQVRDWFKAKGLQPATVRVFSDSVVGTATENGTDVIKRFSLTDGSEWWAVGAKVRAAQSALSPRDLGIPIVQESPQAPLPRDVILDFYGVTPPLNQQAAAALGSNLKRKGWPAITPQQREQWLEQHKRTTLTSSDWETRRRLFDHVNESLRQYTPGVDPKWENQAIVVDPGSALDQCSAQPRADFLALLGSPPFQAFLEKIGVSAADDDFRIHGGDLQQRDPQGQWRSLQTQFDQEIGKHSSPDNASMKAAFDQSVEKSKQTGNALYAARAYDVRQALDFYSGRTPRTLPEIQAALGWITARMAPAPLAQDYAGLTPYGGVPGTLSAQDAKVLGQTSAGIGELLASALATPDSWNTLADDPDRKLTAFFDSPSVVAKAQAWAEALKLYEVADGQALPRALRHQLAATALKLSVGVPLPGKPGEVAGYDLYQPCNTGRALKDVRRDIEAHLINKGISAVNAPIVAHLFLAQAAPEMLVRADKNVPPDAPQLLKQNPEDIKVGTAAWMDLRLGCGIADTLSGPGSSRMMNREEVMALTRLQPQDDEQKLLLKRLGLKPLLDWGTMEGVISKAPDGKYSSQSYETAARAFTEQQDQIRQAFTTLTAEPPTLTLLLIEQLALLFPEMTKDEIRDFKLTRVQDSRQRHLPQNVPLTEVLLAQQEDLSALVSLSSFMRELRDGKSRFKFSHPLISQDTFDERIARLPKMAALVAPAVDRYIADARAAQAVTLKLMISQLPAEDRKALEDGKIEFFSLRKETGDTVDQDSGPASKLRQSIGTHGTLIRYETPGTSPGFAYYEVFPGSMRMIKRTDLPARLHLGGTLERDVSPQSTLSVVTKKYNRDKLENFDFESYRTGSDPRENVQSSVIIGRAAPSLPSKAVLGETAYGQGALRSFKSAKVANMVEGILSNSFEDRRTDLTAHANRLTPHQARRAWPFGADDAFSPSNLKTVLSLIPFVGAVADFAKGEFAAGLKGLVIDLASFLATGGLGAIGKFYKGFKVVLPFGGEAFSLNGLRGSGALLRGLFNPLDGLIDVFKQGPRAIGSAHKVINGNHKAIRAVGYVPAKAFEKGRWGKGAYETVNVDPSVARAAGYTLGSSQGETIYAIQKDSRWYAFNPQTGKPAGAPLTDFSPKTQTLSPETDK